MELSKLDVKHRVVLPKEVRHALGLCPGDRYNFGILDGKVVLRKVSAKVPGAD
jgi:AbrB family looped-hinge helix DNA binding protein